MNDRLAELHAEVPGWAEEETVVVETGQQPKRARKLLPRKRKLFKGLRSKRTNTDGCSVREDSNAPATSPIECNMAQFFICVDAVSEMISAIADAADNISSLRDQAVLASSEAEESKIADAVRCLVNGTNKQALECKASLSSLKDETVELKKASKASPADLRVRDNLVNTLLHKFSNELKRYQNAQERYKVSVKEKVVHQVQLLDPDVTDEEVDQIMRSHGGREALYQQAILRGKVNGQIKAELEKVTWKYKDILSIERSVEQLHQMFLDLAFLVEEQGDLLDHIGYQVETANDYVEAGNEFIYDAIKIQKKKRRKRLIILMVVTVAAVIVMVTVIL